MLHWIKDISNHIFALLRYGRVNVIALAVIYFALWFSPQGHDILVGMPENHWRVISSFIFIFAMGTLNWYFPRLFYPVNEALFDSLGTFFQRIFRSNMARIRPEKPGDDSGVRGLKPVPPPEHGDLFKVDPYITAEQMPSPSVRTRGGNFMIPRIYDEKSMVDNHEQLVSRLLPRALGIATFLVMAGGIMLIYLKYYLLWESSFIPLILSTIVVALSYLFSWGIHRKANWFASKNRWVYSFVLLILLIGGLGMWSTFSTFGLPLLALSLVFASLIFGIFVTIRKKAEALKNRFDDYRMAAICSILISLSVLSFIALNLIPSVSWVFPLNALLQGIIFYIGVTSLLIFWGKSKQTYFLSLFIIGLIILASVWTTDLHKISTLDRKPPVSERVTLEAYLSQWFADRSHLLPDSSSTKKLPLFIVMGEGGGSRAAYWTNLTLGALHQNTQGRFQEHCLAITTVSGSSFGTAVHLAQLYQDRLDTLPSPASFNEAVDSGLTFQENYLSTSLVHFMGADFWRTILPPFYYLTKKKDRAHQLEMEWSKGVQRAMEKLGAPSDSLAFQRGYLSHYYLSKDSIRTDLPLYMPNTTHVGTGNRSVVSPVRLFDKVDHSTEVFDFSGMQGKDFPLAAAALISARFPYINPGGLINPDDQFVDGGYYENIGGVTAKEIMDKVELFLEKKNLRDKVEVHVISIFNGSGRSSENMPVTKKSDGGISPQTLVPVSAFAGTPFSGHTDYWPAYFNGRLNENYHEIILDHNLEVTVNGQKRKVIMPLARYLSESAGEAIRANAKALADKEEFKEIMRLVE